MTRNQSVKASIIIVTYNSNEDLKDCLPALYKQSYTDFEIIIVDNASSDGTLDFVTKNFPNVKLIKNNSNLGYSEGNNIGFKSAIGEYIVILNPDTIPDKEWLYNLISPLESDSSIGATTSKILLHNKNQINTCGNITHYTGLAFCNGLYKTISEHDKRKIIGAVSGCAFAIRKDIFIMIGGFDDSFFLYLEDTDISWRLRLLGYNILYIPESIVYHKFKLKLTPEKLYHLEKNRYAMIFKNYSTKMIIMLLPTLLFTEIMTISFSIFSGKSYIIKKINAYIWFIINYQAILDKRKKILRVINDYTFCEYLDANIPFYQLVNNKAVNRLAIACNSFYRSYFKVVIKLIN
jgi:hypothetical protein